MEASIITLKQQWSTKKCSMVSIMGERYNPDPAIKETQEGEYKIALHIKTQNEFIEPKCTYCADLSIKSCINIWNQDLRNYIDIFLCADCFKEYVPPHLHDKSLIKDVTYYLPFTDSMMLKAPPNFSIRQYFYRKDLWTRIPYLIQKEIDIDPEAWGPKDLWIKNIIFIQKSD